VLRADWSNRGLQRNDISYPWMRASTEGSLVVVFPHFRSTHRPKSARLHRFQQVDYLFTLHVPVPL